MKNVESLVGRGIISIPGESIPTQISSEMSTYASPT